MSSKPNTGNLFPLQTDSMVTLTSSTNITTSSAGASSSNTKVVEEHEYKCLYLGTTLLTDATDRQALKMSARAVLADDARMLAEALVVDLKVAKNELSLIRHAQQTAVFSVRYSHLGACFILRENPRIVTLAVTETSPPGSFSTYGHILLLVTPDEANSLVAAVLAKFSPQQVPSSVPSARAGSSSTASVDGSSTLLFFGSDFPATVQTDSKVMVIPPSAVSDKLPSKVLRPAPPLPNTQSAAQSLCLLDF